MQREIHRLGFGLVSILSLTLSVEVAFAGESIINPEPVGGTDLNQALLPPPGLYGGMAALTPPAISPHITDTNGNILPPGEDMKLKAFIGAAGALYVYPWQVFGGSLASSLQVSVWSLSLAPNSNPGAVIRASAFGDIYSDAFFWSKNVGLFGATPGESKHIPYGLTVAGGFAFKAPTGGYSAVNPLNVGSNLWILTPNLAMTYNTGPNWSLGDSTQFSARLFMSFPLKNPTTNYQSGDVLDVDYSISQIFGNWQAGVTGYYTYQYTNDVGVNAVTGLKCPSAACIDGNRNGQFAIGPVVQYTFPDSGVQIKAKWTTDPWAKDNIKEQQFIVQIAMKLF